MFGCGPLVLMPTPEESQQAYALIDKGTLFLRAGDFEQAVAAYQMSLELAPSAAALDGLGCVALRRKEYGTAEVYFNKAIELDPLYIQSLGNKALLHEERGELAEAEALFEQAALLAPNIVEVRNNYGVFLSERGRVREAQDQYRAAQVVTVDTIPQENLRIVTQAGLKP
jgi:tetratricopeptide (TPR) repeat protein